MKKPLLILSLLLFSIIIKAQFGPDIDISKATARVWNAKFYDLDGDGLLDILSVSAYDSKVSWYKNLGGGNFGTQKIISSNAPVTKLVEAFDIDNDGDLDVITASEGDTLVSIYRNLGNGVFSQKESIINNFSPIDLKIADMDNDSYEDIVLASYSGEKIVWFKNNAGVIDTTQRYILNVPSFAPSRIFLADSDNDGDLDVIFCGGISGLYQLENLGAGIFNFSTNPSPNSISGNGRNIYMEDIDNDGDIDIVQAYTSLEWNENLGNGSFSTRKTISTTIFPASSVFVADIDGDNLKDVICASRNSTNNKITWYKNMGGGVISTTENIITINNVKNIESVFVGDMDNDGDIDILSASELDGKVAIYENTGAGSFNPQKVISNLTGAVMSIASVDIDGDNDMDIISSTRLISSGNVVWYENLGNGIMDNPQIISDNFTGFVYISVGDLDNDGDLDVITVSDNKIAWFENNGIGVFGVEHVISNTVLNVASAYVNDMDNDGLLDIVAISSSPILVWYKNLGNNTFSTANTISSNHNGLWAIHGNDFDNDGDIDIVTADWMANKIEWYENLGNGNFSTKKFMSNASGPRTVFSADVDNDGLIDVVFGNGQGDNGVYWCKKSGSGNFSTGMLVSINSSRTNSVYSTDVDGDGDNDLLSAADNKIYFHENIGGGNFNSTKHIIASRPRGTLLTMGTNYVTTSDLDGDGNPDAIYGSHEDYKLSWSKNYFRSPYGLQGTTFYDQNQNQNYDSNEKGLSVSVNTNNIHYFVTDSGNYEILTDSGFHVINYNLNNNWTLTTDSSTYNRNLTSSTPIINGLDFGFYPNTILSIINPDLTGSFPRCNTIANYWLTTENLGTTIPSGIIHLQLDDSISYFSSLVTPDSIVGQNIYWHYDSLFFFSSETINLQVLLPDFNSMGDTLSSYLTIHEVDNLNNITYTNIDTLHQLLVCAYDPNDKSVSPKGVGNQGYISNNQELEYLIRFQNTGNDTAISVMIRDQLDVNLNWNTMQPISSSHPIQVWIDQDGDAVFNFNNIMLPDSGSDFLGSQGFVKFKIQPDTGLAPNTPIFNTGHIYFDFNPPVITNTVLNTIDTIGNTVAINEIDFTETDEIIAFPNPFQNNLTIYYKGKIDNMYSLVLYDISGKEIFRKDNVTDNKITINVNPLNKGLYIVVGIDNLGKRLFNEKVIAQ